MLNLPVPEAEYVNEVLQPSDEQKELVSSFADRAEDVRKGGVNPKIDNMLKITNDGRKCALDQRLINDMLPDSSESKVNLCVDNAVKLSWAKVAQRVDKLIKADRYLTAEDFARIPDYERTQMARKVIWFYDRLPNDVPRPFKDDFFHEEALKELPSILEVARQSDFKANMHLSTNDHIITLSTCAYSFYDARYVVHGRLTQVGGRSNT